MQLSLAQQADLDRVRHASRTGDLQTLKSLLVGEQQVMAAIQDDDGWTVLHHAAECGRLEVVELLLKSGGIWAMTDHLGHTAGDIAFSLNHRAIYLYLLQEAVRSSILQDLLSDSAESPPPASSPPPAELSTASSNTAFLSSRLKFTTTSAGQAVCLDSEGNGVMMGWEQEIMKRTAESLCAEKARDPRYEGSLSVLNVGFGLGLVDQELQTYKPARHVIVEPHPDVLAYMEERGWGQKPGVEIYPGRWEDYVKAVEAGKVLADFDAVYWDTFSQDYSALKQVFEHLPSLLSGPEAKFSFFHGLGATSRLLYDVYTELAEYHLRDIGMKTEWEEVEVEDGVRLSGKAYEGDIGTFLRRIGWQSVQWIYEPWKDLKI